MPNPFISIIVMIVASLVGWGLSVALGVTSSQKVLKGNNNAFILSWNKKLLLVGAVIEIIGIGLILYMNSTNNDPDVASVMTVVTYIIAIAMVLIFVGICFRVNRFHIVVDGDKITVHPTFTKQYSLTFEDIASADKKINAGTPPVEKILINAKGGQKFKVVSTMYSYDMFANKLREYNKI